jgi:hypothetical protein
VSGEKMNIKNFIIVALLIGLAVCGRAIISSKQENTRLHTELLGKTEEFKKLSQYIGQLEIKYTESKKIADIAKREFKIKDDQIKMLSDATFLMGKHVGTQNGPDYFYQTPKGTKNYVYTEIRVEGKDSPPIGFVMIKNDGRTYKGNYKMEFNVKNVQMVDEETGKIKVLSKAYLIVHEEGLAAKNRCNGCVNWKDKPYPLTITGGTVLVDPTIPNTLKPKMFWWNPKYGMAINGYIDSEGIGASPALEVSLMSYGLTKVDSKFKAAVFGIDFGKKHESFDINFKPVTYRIFESFPNTYFGGGIGYGFDGVRFISGVSVGF